MIGQTERGDFQVTCTGKSGAGPNRIITGVGGLNGNDPDDGWFIDAATAIDWIENRIGRFFTAANGQFVWLTVVIYESGRKTLATEADDATSIILLNLPDCP